MVKGEGPDWQQALPRGVVYANPDGCVHELCVYDVGSQACPLDGLQATNLCFASNSLTAPVGLGT